MFLKKLILLISIIFLVSCGDEYNSSDAEVPEVIDLQIFPYKGSFSDGGLATTNLTCWPTSDDPEQALGYLSTNPAITWKNIPSKTQSFAIRIDLLNEPPTAECLESEFSERECVHWQIYNISPDKTFFPEVKRYPEEFFTSYEANIVSYGGSRTIMGPNWNPSSYTVKGVNTEGKYYLGPCPSGTHEYVYRVTLYALDMMIPDTAPNYSRTSFEKTYAANIITSESLSFKVIGTDFILVSDDFLEGDVVTNPLFACSEEGIMIANGKSPSLRWANEPFNTKAYFLFMQDNASLAISRGLVNPEEIYGSFSSFWPTMGATGGFTIDGAPPDCDSFSCRHWSISNIQMNLPQNYIPIGGINSDLIGPDGSSDKPFKKGFLVGANLFNYSIAAHETSTLFTKMSTVSATQSLTHSDTETTGSGYGYYGPCAPIGSGTRQYQFSLMAVDENFVNIFWNRTDDINLLPETPRSAHISTLTKIQDTLSQMSAENFRYYFMAPTTLITDDQNVPGPIYSASLPDQGSILNGEVINYYRKPANGYDKTEFFRTTFAIDENVDEAGCCGPINYEEAIVTAFVVAEADLRFYFKDVGCELCRFCSIGTIPAVSYKNLWQNYGYSTSEGTTNLPPYNPQLPNQDTGGMPPYLLLQSSDPIYKMNMIPQYDILSRLRQ